MIKQAAARSRPVSVRVMPSSPPRLMVAASRYPPADPTTMSESTAGINRLIQMPRSGAMSPPSPALGGAIMVSK